MPHSFESRPLVRSAKKEWVVQRRKPYVYKGIRTDACVIRIKKYGKKDNFVPVRFQRATKNGRLDLKLKLPETGRTINLTLASGVHSTLCRVFCLQVAT